MSDLTHATFQFAPYPSASVRQAPPFPSCATILLPPIPFCGTDPSAHLRVTATYPTTSIPERLAYPFPATATCRVGSYPRDCPITIDSLPCDKPRRIGPARQVGSEQSAATIHSWRPHGTSQSDGLSQSHRHSSVATDLAGTSRTSSPKKNPRQR